MITMLDRDNAYIGESKKIYTCVCVCIYMYVSMTENEDYVKMYNDIEPSIEIC